MPSERAAALSAALAGVSHPFASRRTQRQHDSPPPPPGTDSCYGVRSLEGSVEWSDAEADDGADSTESAESTDDSVPPIPPQHDPAADPTSAETTRGESSSHDIAAPTSSRDATPEASASAASVPFAAVATDSPTAEPHAPPPCRADASPAAELPAASHPHLAIPHHALLDALADAPSEPSSPVSNASLPSYTASLSSLSRMSSPADWDWRHPLSSSVTALDLNHDAEYDTHSLASLGLGPRGSEELVLPTLSLPSTSLHLGLDRWPGAGEGTRVALLASPERTRDVLGALAARRRCVQLGRGEVGIVDHSGEGLEATVLSGLSVAELRSRTMAAYHTLNALLHPSLSPLQSGVGNMVSNYASTSPDWVHLVVALEDEHDAHGVDVVPVTTLDEEKARLVQEAIETVVEPAGVDDEGERRRSTTPPTPSMSTVPEPTPRLSSHQIEPSPPIPDLLDDDADETPLAIERDNPADALPGPDDDNPLTPGAHTIQDTVMLIERILDDPQRVRTASAATFLAWRPGGSTIDSLPTVPPTQASSLTADTTSPASSNYDVGGVPMPTVARAVGGGEWEATLSRRLAQRREVDASVHRSSRGARARARGRRRRSSHSPPHGAKEPCAPLFPRHRATAASVGLTDLLDGVFGGVKHVLARTPWSRVVMACAVALAVGCGIWAVRVRV
ncbi:hypothetical protein Q8F55_005538 [Vanrija albida]|uniref:Uncharacterized protein n=1 Tax=Vanrija albida TaxID=181172 RepID=A0ABR3Q254_9TREE